MLEVTFLGTSGATPTIARSMPAIAIKHEGDVFLFDCGEGTQRQMMAHDVGYGSLKAVFISHLHLDHFLGIYGLIETIYLNSPYRKSLDIFAPKGLPLLNERSFVQVHEMESGELFDENEFAVRAFPVRHGKNTFGFVITEKDRIKFHEEKAHKFGLKGRMFTEIQKKGSLTVNGNKIKLEDVTFVKPGIKIVYSGDCAPTKKLVDYAKDADLLIHEATFGADRTAEAEERLHSTAEDAAKIAKDANVKQLALVHISPRYADPKPLLEAAKAIFTNTIITYDGLKLALK